MLIHPGLAPAAFDVYLYEHEPENRRPHPTQSDSGIFAMREASILAALKSSDIVVTLSKMPPLNQRGFEFPLTTSLRGSEPVWRAYLDKAFILRHVYIPAETTPVGVYQRRPQSVKIVDYKVPSSIEHWQGHMFFWLGRQRAEIRIDNPDDVEREVELRADSMPGPSNPDRTRRHLHYEIDDQRGVVSLGDGGDWKVSLPMKL